jgi:hypothetical protein
MPLIFPPRNQATTSQLPNNRKEFVALIEKDIPEIHSIFLSWHPEKKREFIQYLQEHMGHQSALRISGTEMSEKLPKILALLPSP